MNIGYFSVLDTSSTDYIRWDMLEEQGTDAPNQVPETCAVRTTVAGTDEWQAKTSVILNKSVKMA